MTTTKFTPGPWEAEPIHADAYPYHIGSYDIVSRSKSMSATVATVAARMSETAKADARLIAAGPEMYGALAEAREFIENLQLPDAEWSRVLDVVVAALAKAVR